MNQLFCIVLCGAALAVGVNAVRPGLTTAGGPLDQVPAAYRSLLETFLATDGKTETCGTMDPGARCTSMPNTVCNDAIDLCLPTEMDAKVKEVIPKREGKCPPLFSEIPNTDNCYFYGPRRCKTVNDCWSVQTAGKPKPNELRYICQDLSAHNGIDGKRCFRECSQESDCPTLSDNKQVSGKVKNYVSRFYGCHENICQLKKQYSHIVRFAKNILGVSSSGNRA